ncbi:DUF5685 family protein [Adlercreutzia shanghongiae]|uniref:DUF5685 family protein n=1 Tax=Adlercreutzia shanghongiae TaxID=3111773 RepID=A0ABU6IY87_9ACTN|nr:DUF5685 family protein [Adlercreutzia sp. R22]MEC4294760.1 DUF5685 family protein [Adlercreutzia sp. R22]
MFGFVVASASSLSDEEKARYQAVYCGLCRALGERYGQAARAALTYDLTFFVLLCDSLHEPAESTGEAHCVTHPVKMMPYAHSSWTDYASDLSVALAYHKCLDDIADDGSLTARAGRAALAGAYAQAEARISEQCAAIEQSMARIRELEKSREEPSPDAAANEFGQLLDELFAHNQGFWAESMRAFGNALGRFVYLMDAAVDCAADERTGSYNPFVLLDSPPEAMEQTLQLVAAEAAAAFERLPLEQDLHLLRSVLYEGIWIQFNRTYRTE